MKRSSTYCSITAADPNASLAIFKSQQDVEFINILLEIYQHRKTDIECFLRKLFGNSGKRVNETGVTLDAK